MIALAETFSISSETDADVAARDALLDRAMGANWRRKSSEKLRRGRLPAVALIARDRSGAVVGTVRLWQAAAGESACLLLGPLAVSPDFQGAGLGSALMRAAIEAARALGHGAVILVGDAAYYARFGFSAALTGNLAMPGPFEKHRLLALELRSGALAGASGILKPTGRKLAAEPVRKAA